MLQPSFIFVNRMINNWLKIIIIHCYTGKVNVTDTVLAELHSKQTFNCPFQTEKKLPYLQVK